MELHSEDFNLITELEAMRPTPRQEFVAELDRSVAGGFAEPVAKQRGGRLARLTQRLRPVSWRRLAGPAGAFAIVAIAIATAVVSVSKEEPGPPSPRTIQRTAGSERLDVAPSTAPAPSNPNEYSGPAVGSVGAESASGVAQSASGAGLHPLAGGYASRASRRRIERSARLVLAADPDEVRAAAAQVLEVVHSYDGIVLSSSTRDRQENATATFSLLIPSGRLDDALASFSEIAEVRSRSDATLDVTAPAIGLGERLRDARARIDGLLGQLADADNDGERASIEAELRAERGRAAALRSRLAALQRRTHFARLSLRIETSSAGSAGDDEAWGIGDALDDAGRILATAAGVTLIGLALLAPIVAVWVLIAVGHRIWARRRRERVLR